MLRDLFRTKEQKDIAARKKRRSDSARRAAITRLANKRRSQEFPTGGLENAKKRLDAQTTVIDSASGTVTEVPHIEDYQDIYSGGLLAPSWEDDEGDAIQRG